MKFFLDECFPKSCIAFLAENGHEVFDPRGTDLEQTGDANLLQESIKRDSIFLTTDRDFYHTYSEQFPDHHGIIVIALRQPNRWAITRKLIWILDTIPPETFAGRVFQVRDTTWHSKPPLP